MSGFDDILKTLQNINKIYSPILQSVNTNAFIAASNTLAESMVKIPTMQAASAMQKSLINFSNDIHASMNVDYFNIASVSEPMKTIVKSVQPSIKMINADISLFKQNYADMILGMSSVGYNLPELVQQACDEIEDEEFIEDDFSSNEEIAEVLQDQADDPKGFQEKVADWSEAKKKKYYILLGIILFIWTNVFQPYIQDTIGKSVAAYTISKVKEIPKAAGKVIGELKKDFQAIITEDVPYYYKVTYTDEKGNVREGYVAKKNLKIIENEEDTDHDVEEEK